jgi:SPASM domain peptide maturase of grasp-with-spasm system
MNEVKLKKYGCCFLVKGCNQSIICDLQYGNVNFIPNDLFNLLQLHDGKSVKELYDLYNHKENETIDEYIAFLLENNYAFWTSEPDRFPPMELQWDFPGAISNILIDIDPNKILLTEQIALSLDQIGAIALQIRITSSISYEGLDGLLELFLKSRIQSIELIMNYEDYIKEERFHSLLLKHLRVNYVIAYSSLSDSKKETEYYSLFFTQEKLKQMTATGPRSFSHFAVNKDIFMEAQFYNAYFNRKLFLDEKLNIGNAPETGVLGNLLENDLVHIVTSAKFQKNWDVKKMI